MHDAASSRLEEKLKKKKKKKIMITGPITMRVTLPGININCASYLSYVHLHILKRNQTHYLLSCECNGSIVLRKGKVQPIHVWKGAVYDRWGGGN